MSFFDLDSSVGIIPGKNALFLSAVSRGITGVTVRQCAIVENYRELEPTQLRSRMHDFVNGGGFDREGIVLGIERDQVIIRTLELPLEVEENLDQVVRFQVNKLEPLDEGESYYDYRIVTRDEKRKMLTLQLVMAPRAVVDQWLEWCSEMELYPAAIKPSSYGLHELLRSHSEGYAGTPAIIVNVDELEVEIVVAQESGNCESHRFESETPIDARRIQEELDLFLSGVRLPEEGVHQVYVTGPRADALVEPLRDIFGDGARLTEGLEISGEGVTQGQMQRGASTLGLALSGVGKSLFRSFNLIPAERRLVGLRPSLIPTAVLAVCLILLLVAAASREYFQQGRVLEALEARIASLRPEAEEALSAREAVNFRLQELEEIQEFMTGEQNALIVLRELTENIPESAYLQSLNIQGDKVNMTGFAASGSRASSLINILMASDYLTDVESRYINRMPRTGEEKFNFEARIRTDSGSVEP